MIIVNEGARENVWYDAGEIFFEIWIFPEF